MISMPDGPRQYEEGALKGLFLRYLSGTRKELQNIAQLIQSYCRLAELEITSEERSRAADVALPEDSSKKARKWAQGEGTKAREREELAGELGAVMQAHGHGTEAVRAVMGG